jgi:hypothetical protein
MLTGGEWWRLLPTGASGDALRILAARGVRAFADGFVALLPPIYLVEIGFDSLAVGAIVVCTLIGTALLTLWVGLYDILLLLRFQRLRQPEEIQVSAD